MENDDVSYLERVDMLKSIMRHYAGEHDMWFRCQNYYEVDIFWLIWKRKTGMVYKSGNWLNVISIKTNGPDPGIILRQLCGVGALRIQAYDSDNLFTWFSDWFPIRPNPHRHRRLSALPSNLTNEQIIVKLHECVALLSEPL